VNQTVTNILLCVLIAVVLIATAMVQQGLKQQNQHLQAFAESVEALNQRGPAGNSMSNAASPDSGLLALNGTGVSANDSAPGDQPDRPGGDGDGDAGRQGAGGDGGDDGDGGGDGGGDRPTGEPGDSDPDVQTNRSDGPGETRDSDADGRNSDPSDGGPASKANGNAIDGDSAGKGEGNGPADPSSESRADPERAAVESAWKEHRQPVVGAIRELLAGQYQAVRDRLTADLRGQMTVDMMDSVMTPIRQRHGGFKEVLDYDRPDRYVPAGVHAFVVEVATERDQPLTFSITIDPGGRIAGLMIK